QMMERAIEIAETYDVKLGLEPELANVVNSIPKAGRLITQLQSDRLKIVLDPVNLFEKISLSEQKRVVSEAVESAADHLVMAHAKDRSPDGEFTTAGKGILDFRHFLQALSDCGFDGPLVTHGLTAQHAPGVARFLRKILKQVK
ncbi:MAG: sugar phosphate isomerase/epimerase, partial [Hyphomicrobiales bacterium]